MVAKQKGEAKELEEYKIDWKKQARRPFKRGFVPYGSEDEPKELIKRRKAYGVEVIEDPAGDDVTPAPVDSFEELGALPPWLLDALRDDERLEPTPLQAQALPIALAGQNMVALVPAADGHAAAHLIPAIVHVEDQPALDDEDPGPVVLILTPTQETAAKVIDEAASLLRHSTRSKKHTGGMRAVSVSGGGTRSEKLKELTSAGAHIVVGTPKRVRDMAAKEQLSLLRVTMLVLDSADKMLTIGFEDDIKELASWVRPERHTCILSATWPKTLHELASERLCYCGGEPVRFSAPLHVPGSVAKTGGGEAAAARPGAKAGAKAAAKPGAKAAAGKPGAKGPAKASVKEEAAEPAAAEEEEAAEAPVEEEEPGAEAFPDDW